jgi:hypothetical protein
LDKKAGLPDEGHCHDITKAVSSAPGTQVEVETLKIIVMFRSVGLLVSFFAAYGLDLGAGFF